MSCFGQLFSAVAAERFDVSIGAEGEIGESRQLQDFCLCTGSTTLRSTRRAVRSAAPVLRFTSNR